MKFVWVTHDAKISGANQCMLEVIEALKALGHTNEVILTRERELAGELKKMDIPYHVLLYYNRGNIISLKKIKQSIRNLIAIIQLVKLFRIIKPDKVISNTITVGVGAWTSLFSNKAHCWYVHEFGKEDHGIKFPFGEFLANKLMGWLSEKIIVVSNALKEKYAKYTTPDKIDVLYNYPIVTNVAEAKRYKKENFDLMMLGQIAPGKRQEDAIRAVKILIEKKLDIHLSIFGNVVDANYHKTLLEIIAKNGLKNNIHFEGYIPNPYQLITNANAMLVCSKAEAFGRVTVEAMMLGTPVIGADSGATKELVKHNKTGLLYKCCNANDLAEKIEYLYNDEDLLKELSENCYRFTKLEFSKEKFLKNLIQVFD